MSDKRTRVKRACDVCRRRKRGCDEKHPCGPCVQSKLECTYATTWTTHPARNNASRSGHDTSRLSSPATQRAFNGATRWSAKPPSPASNHIIQPPVANEQQSSSTTVVKGLAGAGLISEDQPRFVQNSSAIAFPRILGFALKAERPPKLHCFAYNLGLRQEEISIDYGVLPITAEEVRQYSEPFFNLPIGLINRDWFMEKVTEYYQHPRPHLGTIIGGVFALGSCLSEGHAAERDVVHWCKCCLEDASAVRRPSLETIIGFGLRSWYLRMTTRPNCAWLASCTVTHLMESVGLHREENIDRLTGFSSISAAALRMLFWNLWAAHRIVSYEYGRTHVELDVTTRRPESPFLELVTTESLQELQGLHFTHPFLISTKADVALSIFRRQWQSKAEIDESILLEIGDDALETAERLCADPGATLYYNTLGSCFQYTCALIALRSPNSLARLGKAFDVLSQLADRGNTFMAREPLSIANALLGALIDEKRGELNGLDTIFKRGIQTPASDTTTDDILNFDWALFDADFGVMDAALQ